MDGPVFLDFFAGFGGSSSGLVEAGFELSTAYNHWETAIAVHAANHRRADHVQGDLSGYDMRRLPRRAEVLWASPECTWHSPAGGRRRPSHTESDLFGERQLPAEAGVRSRATMFDPIRAAEARRFKVVVIENVPEVASWQLFDSWLHMWEALGYSWQIVNVSAAHIYGPGNPPAGQWRDRIYIVLAAKGVRMPRLEPHPLAWCPQCDRVVEARQWWKRDRLVGKYRQQYVYVCAANAHARQVVEPYVLPAAQVIDWSDCGVRIGDRAAAGMPPLAAATMRRIEMGARMFGRPTVVAHTGQTWDAANPAHPHHGDPGSYWRVWPADSEPLMTRQAGGSGDGVCVPPYMIAVNHGGAEGRAQRLTDGPLPTRSTKIGDGLVFPPYVVEYFGTSTARGVDEPLSAVLAGAQHHGVVVPPGAFLSRQYSTRAGDAGRHLNSSVWEPTHAITGTGGNHALVVPRTGRPEPCEELPFDLDDASFRMLGPVEHLRAQRFWEGYDTSAANKSETTRGAGNAVAVNVAHWIGDQVKEALAA